MKSYNRRKFLKSTMVTGVAAVSMIPNHLSLPKIQSGVKSQCFSDGKVPSARLWQVFFASESPLSD